MRREKAQQSINILILFLIMTFISCDDIKTVQIWTDHPEFALYGEYYNTMQNRYKVSVRYMEFPIAELNRNNSPDIIIASRMKNSSTQSNFKSLNNIFGSKKISRNIFNQRLLADGRIDRNHYLLPVSYNIPALIFSKDREQEISNQFTIDFSEIKESSLKFNTDSRGSYTRMGFSPLWNNKFLLTAAFLLGASFTEGEPLAWDSNALDQSMLFISNWTKEINTSSQMEEDFTFKYFYESPERLIQSGRILFSYMESSELFLLGDDTADTLDFRWIMEKEQIPITEDTVYLGIPKWSKSQDAARAFIMWFFKFENQRLLLEYSRLNRIDEKIFGINGGFSSLNPVTEQIYPLFYPELLGRMPPSEYFVLPNTLPANWTLLKERVVLPYLNDRARSSEEIYSLERRLADWIRLNR
jgi:ABC-type glycerol-3-phosphate transport system substrate-binding protein